MLEPSFARLRTSSPALRRNGQVRLGSEALHAAQAVALRAVARWINPPRACWHTQQRVCRDIP